jgi:serine/threonine-protein kinase RsbW
MQMIDVIELTIPVRADLVVLARLTAATVASRAEFDVEEIEDLRLAVDELCVSLVQGGVEGQLDLQFSRDEDRVEVSCSYESGMGDAGRSIDPSLVGLSALILDALVDEHGEETQDGKRRAWLRKRRAQHSH